MAFSEKTFTLTFIRHHTSAYVSMRCMFDGGLREDIHTHRARKGLNVVEPKGWDEEGLSSLKRHVNLRRREHGAATVY
jgi:hypothetical protein